MKLFLITIAWILGIIMGLYFKIGIAFLLCVILIVYLLKRRNNNINLIIKNEFIIVFILALTISFVRIIYLENIYEIKYSEIANKENITGIIVSNPKEKNYTISYTLEVEGINFYLYVKKNKNTNMYKYGDKILLTGEFKQPEVRKNTGGFSYKEYLKTQKVCGIINTSESSIKLISHNNCNYIYIFINSVSLKIIDNISKMLPEKESSVLIGILIGNKDNLDEDLKETFRKSSLSHMLAVSGMHVSYVVMIIGFITNKSKMSRNKANILTILLLLFFMILTKETVSVTRACLMSTYMIIAKMFHKKVTVKAALNISLLFILIINPYSLLDIGLQLSYGGTLGIILTYKKIKMIPKIRENKSKIVDLIFVTVSANIVLIPIIMYQFNTLSLTFVISNILTSPIIGVIVILGFIVVFISFIFMPISQMLSIILVFALKVFIFIAETCSKLPLSQILVPTPNLIIIIFYYLTISFLFSKAKLVHKKKLISILFILIIISRVFIIIPVEFELDFINVGQGDSSLIITPNRKTILIDGGGNDKDDSVGENTLIPYLLDRQITKIDYIIVSHFDSDHVKGLLSVMEKLKVDKVIISKQGKESENYERFKKIVKSKKIKVIEVKKRR